MKVRTYESVPLRLDNPGMLLEKIKNEGIVREPNSEGTSKKLTSSVHIGGVYFLAGGRQRIADVLKAVSGGAFFGHDLTAHMINLNRKNLAKTSTLICIAPSNVWKNLGADSRWQKISLPGSRGAIPFSQFAGLI